MLSRLTIRARLLVLGIGAVAMLGALGAVAIISMQGMSSQSSQSTHDQNAAQLLSHAYESWILDDDQSNMYAAVLALNDPSQHQLAETTWGQAAAAYTESAKQLNLGAQADAEHGVRAGAAREDRDQPPELQRVLAQAPRLRQGQQDRTTPCTS